MLLPALKKKPLENIGGGGGEKEKILIASISYFSHSFLSYRI